jgi:SHO1 osmosensor
VSANNAQLAWIIAFVSSIISATQGSDARFPNYAWWTIVFMFFCIIGVTVTVASEAERTYHVAVRGAGAALTDALADSDRLSASSALDSSSPPHLSTPSFTHPLHRSRLPLLASFSCP